VLAKQEPHYVLKVNPKARQTREFEQLGRLLGLDKNQLHIEIDVGQGMVSQKNNRLLVNTRSVLATMAYLSNAVRVPAMHRSLVNDIVPDSNALLSDLLTIEAANIPVENAYLSVPYRGYWFYIKDTDINSKQTLGLLKSLIRLHISAGGAQTVPILTLPVGQ
jgi:hypothetical protein